MALWPEKVLGGELFPAQGDSLLTGFFAARGGSRRGTRELIATYRSLPWVRANVGKIGFRIASTNWRLFIRRTDGRAVRDRDYLMASFAKRMEMRGHMGPEELQPVDGSHPFLRFLDFGNPRLNGHQGQMVTQALLDLKGEVFWMLERNGAGIPIEYWPLPPHWIRELPGPSRPFFSISFGGVHKDVPEDDMIWFKQADPSNPYGRGVGIAESLADELDIDEAAAKYTKSFFLNDATPSMLIGVEGASKDELQRAKQTWLDRHRGVFKNFVPHFFRGKLDVKQLSSSLGDLMITELRKLQRDTVHQVFNIPPEMLGIVDKSNRATIAAARSIFAEEVMIPRLEFLRTQWQLKIVDKFDSRLILEFDDPRPENEEFKLKAARANPASLDQNEWRAIQGLEPKESLRDLHLFPTNVFAQRLNGQAPEQIGPPPEGSSHLDDDKLLGEPRWVRALPASTEETV